MQVEPAPFRPCAPLLPFEGIRGAIAPICHRPKLGVHAQGGVVERHGEEAASRLEHPVCLRAGRVHQRAVGLDGVQGALVQHNVELAVVEVESRDVHLLPPHLRHGARQALPQELKHMRGDVDVDNVLVSGGVHLLRQVGVTAPEHQNAARGRKPRPQHIGDGTIVAIENDARVPSAIPIVHVLGRRLVVVVFPIPRVGVGERVASEGLHLLVRQLLAALVEGPPHDADHRAQVPRHRALHVHYLAFDVPKLDVQLLHGFGVQNLPIRQHCGDLRHLLEPQGQVQEARRRDLIWNIRLGSTAGAAASHAASLLSATDLACAALTAREKLAEAEEQREAADDPGPPGKAERARLLPPALTAAGTRRGNFLPVRSGAFSA
mmetsp:Transcript_82105/g.265973  ORF Transcript_82105/g.265973 Transcript_82105/m.265973 type:complete len:378 (-) Transcript_82105:137-1270(-)